MTGMPMAPRPRGGVGDQAQAGSVQRSLKPRPTSSAAVMATGRQASRAFQNAPEAKPHQDELQALVVRTDRMELRITSNCPS